MATTASPNTSPHSQLAGPLAGIGGVPVVTGPILKMWLPNELEQFGTAFPTACPPPLCCLGVAPVDSPWETQLGPD